MRQDNTSKSSISSLTFMRTASRCGKTPKIDSIFPEAYVIVQPGLHPAN
jgi:hypothetical protein